MREMGFVNWIAEHTDLVAVSLSLAWSVHRRSNLRDLARVNKVPLELDLSFVLRDTHEGRRLPTETKTSLSCQIFDVNGRILLIESDLSSVTPHVCDLRIDAFLAPILNRKMRGVETADAVHDFRAMRRVTAGLACHHEWCTQVAVFRCSRFEGWFQ